jgi:acyl-CoA synthetase (AMP-forming)/AMP-acid ligase II
MLLFNEIEKQTSLNFIDATTNVKYQFQEILYDLSVVEKEDKQLVFLYSSNTVNILGAYFSFLKGNFTIALLNEELNLNLKMDLEKRYCPSIIVDKTRNEISAYSIVSLTSKVCNLHFFYNISIKVNVHSKIKLLLSTSGTTGSPKFVKLSEENLYQNVISIIDYLPIQEEDVVPLNLPIFYSYGLSILHSNAFKGVTIVCNVDDVLSKGFWNQFDKYGFTSIAGVPFVYEMLDRIGFRKKQYKTLRYISQAGGNLNENIKLHFLDYCESNNIKFYVMYGQTEATARISYVPFNELEEKILSIGKPVLNGKLFIDEITNELVYEGPNIFGGYADGKESLSIWENREKLFTGDLAKKDVDGFYYITGRMKRFVKVFGNRVNLDEIEVFLKRKIEGVNFACIGIKDKYIIVFLDSNVISMEDVKSFISKELEIHSSVIKFKLINDFPLTSNGKINYKELEISYEL